MVYRLHPPRFGGLCECGDHAWADLTYALVVLVSVEDVALIREYAWYAREDHNQFYAARQIERRPTNMHRVLLDYPHDAVDHINGWGCDNRRSNLRLASPSQNAFNARRKMKAGIRRPKGRRKWNATITKDGVLLFIGAFDTREEAVAARDQKAAELFGDFVPKDLAQPQTKTVILKEGVMKAYEVRGMDNRCHATDEIFAAAKNSAQHLSSRTGETYRVVRVEEVFTTDAMQHVIEREDA